jgi:hypothetical protein
MPFHMRGGSASAPSLSVGPLALLLKLEVTKLVVSISSLVGIATKLSKY